MFCLQSPDGERMTSSVREALEAKMRALEELLAIREEEVDEEKAHAEELESRLCDVQAQLESASASHNAAENRESVRTASSHVHPCFTMRTFCYAFLETQN